MQIARLVRESAPFRKLEPAILDCCQELLSPADYRFALYYGNNERLEPLWPVRWMGDPPTYTKVAGGENEVSLPYLFTVLRAGPGGAYIQDVDNPSREEVELLDAVRDKHHFKYFACYAISSTPLVSVSNGSSRDLAGAFILQVAKRGPLESTLQYEFFPLLTNVLAAGYLATAAFI